MDSSDSGRTVTDIHVRNVITLLEGALSSDDTAWRAQYLAEAQRQLGWAQRRAIDECQQIKMPWRQIGSTVGVAHDALYRQYSAGGPIVTVAPFYRRDSRNVETVAHLAIGFRTIDDGRMHVVDEASVTGLDSFAMAFNPANPSPYSGRDLQYYFRPAPGLAIADLGRSAGYALRPQHLAIAVSITEAVMDELFGPPILGTAERRRWEADLEVRRDLDLDEEH